MYKVTADPCGPSSGLRRGQLRRYAPLRSVPVLLPGDVRQAVETRSGGVCEIARVDCLGVATQVHHRVRRGGGGRHGAALVVSDQLANLLHACAICHGWAHEHPAAAREEGWLLKRHQVPALEPVLYRGVLCYLSDDGRVEPFEAVGA
jgi:hypothetical protein